MKIKKTIGEFAKQLPYEIPEYMKPVIEALTDKRLLIIYPKRCGQSTAYKLAKEYRIFLEGDSGE